MWDIYPQKVNPNLTLNSENPIHKWERANDAILVLGVGLGGIHGQMSGGEMSGHAKRWEAWW